MSSNQQIQENDHENDQLTDRSYQDKCSLTIFPVTHVVEITNLELKLGCTTINRGGLETH